MHEKNFKVSCCYSNCICKFRNLPSYFSHLKKHLRYSSSKPCICMLCKQCFKSLRDLLFHFKFHFLCKEFVTCPFKNCNKKYKLHVSMKAHISRFHKQSKLKSEVQDFEKPEPFNRIAIENVQIENEDMELIENEDMELSTQNLSCDTKIVVNKGEMNSYIGLFLLKLQAKYNIPSEAVDVIVSGISDILNMNLNCLLNRVFRYLKDCENPDETLSVIKETITQNVECLKQSYISSHVRMKHFTSLGLISPREIILGQNKFRKICSYQYVPVRSSLSQLLNHEDVIEQILHPRYNENVIKDFSDGRFFHKNSVFGNSNNALCLILYFDEFELVNPIGASRKKHKMAAFYYILGNIYPEFRSLLKCISLLIMCKSADLKYFTLQKILEPFLSDMKELSHTGIEVPGLGVVPCGVFCVAGDNLGSHFLGGYVECFRGSSAFICRHCHATGEEINKITHEDRCYLRSQSTYNSSSSLIAASNSNSVDGVKLDSPLNELPGFHVQEGLPPDIMHDLFEGIVPYEIKLILSNLKLMGYVTADVLNMRICHFPFNANDVKNKPVEQPLDFKTIVGTAAQKWCLLRFLPLLIGDLIPEGNKEWHLLLNLRVLVTYLLSESFSHGMISVLQDMIKDHLEMFLDVFPCNTLKPKHHYLVHYPRHILNFGPLIRYWCFRFESKHSVLKEIIRHAKQFKNPCKTLSVKHELKQCYEHNVQKFLNIDIECVSAEQICLPLIDKNIIKLINSIIVAPLQEVFCCNSIKINGTTYKIGFLVASHYCKGDLVWGSIKYILLYQENVYFLLNLCISKCYDHYDVVQIELTGKYSCISYNKLADWYPLAPYEILNKNVTVIVPRHILLDCGSMF